MKRRIIRGDALSVLRTLPAESIDSLVTDPPAGIKFMGRAWDGDKGGRRQWVAWLASIMEEARRTLKPGAHGLVWALPRTSHWTATALEDAGFEIRDVGVHLFGTGFPKHRSLLKPASEHWILVRAPGELQELSIEACRIGTTVETWPQSRNYRAPIPGARGITQATGAAPPGRWPANLTLDEHAAAALDAQSGELGISGGTQRTTSASWMGTRTKGEDKVVGFGDRGGASRFFYVAKASKRDRGQGNTHPTVKSTSLMRWLARLVTPPGGTVLDPFAGSGTTGVACAREGFRFIGIEREAEYAAIARRRLNAA